MIFFCMFVRFMILNCDMLRVPIIHLWLVEGVGYQKPNTYTHISVKKSIEGRSNKVYFSHFAATIVRWLGKYMAKYEEILVGLTFNPSTTHYTTNYHEQRIE